jgi:hypothetical protein
MEDITPGDIVFDEMGAPCTVQWCSEISNRESYKVMFSDGSEIIADGDHLWNTVNASARAALYRTIGDVPKSWATWKAEGNPVARDKKPVEVKCYCESCNKPAIAHGLCAGHNAQRAKHRELTPLIYSRPQSRTITTLEMRETLKTNRHGDTNHSIPATYPLMLPIADLSIDPYLLGVWLGDGTSASGSLTINETDEDIISKIRSRGYIVKKLETKLRWSVEGLTRELRLLGVLNNKHIPASYLRSSFKQRLDLLHGLMDTDGYAGDTNQCEFCSTSKSLAYGVYELAVSLGFIVTIKESRARLYGKDIGPKWRLFFTPSYPPFSTARKATKIKYDGARKGLRKLRYVVGIESVGVAPVRCISVSSESKLYLAGEAMIPTHNSTTSAILALHTAMYHPGSLILVISPSLRQSRILFKKITDFRKMLRPRPVLLEDNKLSTTFANGSQIVALPGTEGTIRGYSAVTLILEDEAAKVSDDTYLSTRPMLAISNGRHILMSTPFGKRGHFFEEWENGGKSWVRIEIPAQHCPRISEEFLQEEFKSLGDWWFSQEYLCQFRDTTDSLFKYDQVMGSLDDDLEIWSPEDP